MGNCLLCKLPGFRVHHGYGLLSCMQIAAYNFHLGLLVPSLLVGYRKVYSGGREADVLMSSATPVIATVSKELF